MTSPLGSVSRAGLLGVALMLLAGCVRSAPGPLSGDVATAGSKGSPGPTIGNPPPVPRQLPAFEREPEIGVLLAQGRRLVFDLPNGATLPDGRALAPGRCTAEIDPGGWRIGGHAVSATLVVIEAATANGVRFRARPDGSDKDLRFAGRPVLHRNPAGGIALIERIPLDGYLAGVVGVEMNPNWPAQALAAQAIAARSYAAARWMAASDQPWQLHHHFSVDMAYHGVPAKSDAAAGAVAATRGQVLWYRGQPVLARFHAASGGRTESAANLWPAYRAPDGITSQSPVMPVVDDPACARAAVALRLPLHQDWTTEIPLKAVTEAVRTWAAQNSAERAKPAVGAVTAVDIASREADSGRVRTVQIRHHGGEIIMPAVDLRRLLGSGTVRSTRWDACAVANGRLIIRGHGYGHGVGLSQISAWQMARDGSDAAAILARFYPGAELVRRY